ncbi:hypothetical protein HBH92_042070 [Parastagonospora nodorum]|nr:hypothetical protein HBH50_017500 [Parastagonospora nodorum]KAH4098202.1 hypothetical protein HBH48_029800 [Parastagonospora nodorum]KAH4180700.1 hypothetical protein HBH43_007660 [Parastagonospora nodorum]KAH4419172.1 hypothetical protein HBH92_042070 [Parastagonospora nodorum]KAH4445958.1 hypothetical protein HBH93_058280 [Parastagonospora nodorum]
MESDAPTEDRLLPGLLRLPNELLIKTVFSLSNLDLRRLARVNKKLSFFVGSYLTRFRYNAGILKLPDELLLEVAQHLSTQTDRSHFAQASLRLYPIVMNYVAHYDLRYNASSLLMFAARWNLMDMARKILNLRGDINTHSVSHHYFKGLRARPLSNAAYFGHKQVVCLLLESGAVELIDTIRLALELAITNGHEQIAIQFSQALPADAMIFKGEDSLFQLACEAKMINLVRFLLERGYQRRTAAETTRGYSTHLHRLIAKDSVGSGYIERGQHDEVYQIATMLLQHKADPDARREAYRGVFVSTRRLACRHPGLRVRDMLSRTEAVFAPRYKASHFRSGTLAQNHPREASMATLRFR